MDRDDESGLASSDKKTPLAFERTRMAAERTLMAWIRTCLSMIGFGFTIVKFFQYLNESTLVKVGVTARGPLYIGLTLIVLGMVFLVIASLEHRQYLYRLYGEKVGGYPLSIPLVAAFLLLLIGFLALVNILFQWFRLS